MSIWETSNDPGSKPAITFDRDKHFPDNRPADGTAAAATNKGPQDQAKPFLTYKDGKLTVFDGGRYTIFVGVLDSGRSVALILKPDAPTGMDVFNAPPEWLTLNSEQDVFKIVDTNSIPYSFGGHGGFESIVIPHGLSFVPIILAFVGIPGSFFYPLPWINTAGLTATEVKISSILIANADSSNVSFTTQYGTANSLSGLTLNYYLLQQSSSSV